MFICLFASELKKVHHVIRPQRLPNSEVKTAASHQDPNKPPRLNLAYLLEPDYLIVTTFAERKLAFVFRDKAEANCFLLCMQLLTICVSGRGK